MNSEKGVVQTTIYRGGTVLVMDGATPAATAMVTRNRGVAGVGDEDEMRALAGPHAEVVDLGGATVMPGLIDTHPHVLHFGALTYPLADISEARCYDDIVARLREKAAEKPAGQWVMATPVGEGHYFLRSSWRDLAEGELPDRHVLDAATSDHPVLIQAWAPTTPNVCVFNTAALATLGITRDTPERTSNVWVEKDERGEPTGRLRGSVNNYYSGDPYMDDLLRNIPLFEPEEAVAGTRKAMGEYNRMGVTTVYEGHAMGPAEIGIYQMLRQEDALTLRVLTALEAELYGFSWNQALSMEEFEENLALAASMTSVADEQLRHNGVTLSRGGPCGPGFLRMNEPYKGPYGDMTTGVTFVSEEKEEFALEYCATHDLRLNFIGAGYRDHDEFLPHAEALDKRIPIAGRHWILQHNYLCTKEQARRYAALGFDVTTSMSFSWAKGELMRERIGNHALSDLIPLRRLLDAGLVVGCGTDWGPKNVFEHVGLAETHEFCVSGHRNDTAAHAVGREEALLMWTRDAARVLGWSGIGTLTPGSAADFIVLDRNPMTCDLDALPATQVMRTVLGGSVVHDSGEL